MSDRDTVAASPTAPTVETVVLVAAGGALGSTGRWLVGVGLDLEVGAFPWSTVLVNVLGCLLIGLAARRLERGSAAWSFVVTGALGGFTTMSAFAVELNELVDADRAGEAAALLVVTLVGGGLALLIGERAPR